MKWKKFSEEKPRQVIAVLIKEPKSSDSKLNEEFSIFVGKFRNPFRYEPEKYREDYWTFSVEAVFHSYGGAEMATHKGDRLIRKEVQISWMYIDDLVGEEQEAFAPFKP
jgi:hypothetical protein